MPPFVCETEEVKILFSGLYVVFERTLVLHSSFKFSRQKYACGFVLCLCFPNKLTSNFLRKRRLMWFGFVSIGEQHNKYQESRICRVHSPAVRMMRLSLQLFPNDWTYLGPYWRTNWARVHLAPVLSFLAVCSSLFLNINWKVNLHSSSTILVGNLLDNKKWKTLRE